MSVIEILAPAGSADALKAAVRSGAAAVYLGADCFNARQHAQNFDKAALKEAVEYCHIRGVKVYLTLNTLIRDEEMDDALSLAKYACKLGIDALIVQDLGLAARIRKAAPDMPLHASTQLACHTPDGVRFLQNQGFSRVVLAREMSLEEITACAQVGCELEVFVHGALCMSVSGQCYLSAVLGGRSGNRGHCAGPCRLPFSAKNTPDRTGGYALSLKDQCLAQYIPALQQAGVVSLKIEGRMKRPEYVAAAVSVCKAAADGGTIPHQALEDLQAVFSRSGFTDGYYTGKRNEDMFGIRRQENVVAAATVLKRLARSVEKEYQNIPITMHLTATIGNPVILTVQDNDGHTVTVEGQKGEIAKTVPTTEERVVAALTKTGDTPYLATATATVQEGCMLPVSAINGMRREGLERLSNLRKAVKPIPFSPADNEPIRSLSPSHPRVIRLQQLDQYSEMLQNEVVILPLSLSEEALNRFATTHQAEWGVEIPRGLFDGMVAVKKQLDIAQKAGASYGVCGNCNAIPLLQESGLKILGEYSMNVCNAYGVDVCQEQGFSALVLSPELKFSQMAFAKTTSIPCGVFVYGRLPLMLTRNCPVKAAGKSCRECRQNGSLTDRKGVTFPVTCQNGCAELLNSVPTYLGDQTDSIPGHLFHWFHFTDETQEEVCAVLQQYRDGQPSEKPITRGLYKKGVL